VLIGVAVWVPAIAIVTLLIRAEGQRVALYPLLGAALGSLVLVLVTVRYSFKDPGGGLMKLGKRWPTVGPWRPWAKKDRDHEELND
jgi:hypothetical protein